MPQSDGVSPQPVLLGLLMSEPRHGYELYQEFSEKLGWVWEIGLSKLYAQLRQLEEAELVEAQLEPQPNRPARKVYRLTSEGRDLFWSGCGSQRHTCVTSELNFWPGFFSSSVSRWMAWTSW